MLKHAENGKNDIFHQLSWIRDANGPPEIEKLSELLEKL